MEFEQRDPKVEVKCVGCDLIFYAPSEQDDTCRDCWEAFWAEW